MVAINKKGIQPHRQEKQCGHDFDGIGDQVITVGHETVSGPLNGRQQEHRSDNGDRYQSDDFLVHNFLNLTVVAAVRHAGKNA